MTGGGDSLPPGDDSRRAGDDQRHAEEESSPTGDDPPTCDEAGCSRNAAVRLHVPWSDDRAVCPAHARVLARPDGVVAEPIEGSETEWP